MLRIRKVTAPGVSVGGGFLADDAFRGCGSSRSTPGPDAGTGGENLAAPERVVSETHRRTSCSLAAVVVEQSAETRAASDRPELRVAVSGDPFGLMRWLPIPWWYRSVR